MGRLPLAIRLSSLVTRHPRLVLALALALTLAAILPAARIRIDDDLTALLPTGSRGAEDYRLFLRTFGGFEKVFVVVRSPGGHLADPGPLLEAAAALADFMRGRPDIADARSGLTEEDQRFFFRYVAPRLPLLVEGKDWRRDLERRLSPAALHERVAFMRHTMSTPAGSAVGQLFASDPLGLAEGLLAAASSAIPMDPLSGGFLSRQGDAALVILTPVRAEIDPEGGRALLATLRQGYARVRAGAAVPLEFQAVGGPIYAAEDEGVLRGDLTRTASSTAAGVAVVLLAGFEGVLLPLVILLAVLAGIVWTAGAVGLCLGTVTVAGVGFAAALLGMGVDYGIHGCAHFRELRWRGEAVAASLAGAFRETGPGIATAAAATALGLAALSAAHFRPLREVGEVLGIGVAATLVATATLSAALLAVGSPGAGRRLPAPPRLWGRRGLPALRALIGIAVKYPRAVLGAALLLTAGAAWGLAHSELSTDLRAMRPANQPSARAERLLVSSFGLGLDTLSVVIRGRDLDQALDRAAAVRRLLEARLGAAAEITSPSDWLVQGGRLRRRLDELRALPFERAARDLERELAAVGFRLEPFAAALAALRAVGRGEDPGGPPAGAWPRWMSELVRSGPGVYGLPPGGAAVAVHVRLPLDRSRTSPEALARELSAISPDIALASIPRVGAELKELAMRDLVRSSGIALLAIAAVVMVSFRGRASQALLAFLPLTLGCLWTFGIWGALGRPIDLLGVFTVPLLLGTGIDLGAHAVHWRRLHPERGLAGAVEDVGLAMILATFTTAVGFGSLSYSRVPGLQHAGILVSFGITACLAATLLVLPALEALRGGPASGVGSLT
ncbi:MAG TPA: MMPL family transporter [Thermoanaerobaculia bacterium]|nr:MMPL family transporter [Thermoanaerobaculia bacterium]